MEDRCLEKSLQKSEIAWIQGSYLVCIFSPSLPPLPSFLSLSLLPLPFFLPSSLLLFFLPPSFLILPFFFPFPPLPPLLLLYPENILILERNALKASYVICESMGCGRGDSEGGISTPTKARNSLWKAFWKNNKLSHHLQTHPRDGSKVSEHGTVQWLTHILGTDWPSS